MCDAVRYEVADAFQYAVNCHLLDLPARDRLGLQSVRRHSARQAARHQGEDSLLLFGDEETNDTRCKVCGSFLFSVVQEGRVAHIAMGTLVDEPTIRPRAHIFVGSKAPWFEITDGLPQYEEYEVGGGA